jgi:glutamine synthetase
MLQNLTKTFVKAPETAPLTMVEYVWIGGSSELRSKTRVMHKEVNTVDDLSQWNYDGSSTGQAEGHASEIILIPGALFNDPIRGAPHKMVMCETQLPTGEPALNNNRHFAKKLFDQALEEEPWFGLEQEYFIMDSTNQPLGYSEDKKQGQFYCSAGSANAYGRQLVEDHLSACIDAGINISGVNAEVAAGQWEYQIGPCVGIEQGDHLWMARYLMERLSEKYGVSINIEPKPLAGDWNGSGCHANYSTKNMREGTKDKTGLEYIHEAVEKLSAKHMEHMDIYGKDNDQRLSGAHETSPYDEFSVGVGNRGSSVRIGNEAINDKKGYFEDRRPGSNCDPYLVSGMLFKTTILE